MCFNYLLPKYFFIITLYEDHPVYLHIKPKKSHHNSLKKETAIFFRIIVALNQKNHMKIYYPKPYKVKEDYVTSLKQFISID